MVGDVRKHLTDEEIDALKIKIGKSHRTQKDWAFIKELLADKSLFTANPINEDVQKRYTVEGILKDSGALIIFTSVQACKDYLDQTGTQRFGWELTIGDIPFQTVMEIAVKYQERVYMDPNDIKTMKMLGIDGKTQTFHVYAMVKP